MFDTIDSDKRHGYPNILIHHIMKHIQVRVIGIRQGVRELGVERESLRWSPKMLKKPA